VILGPTEARVARYLEDATRHGRVTLRTVELADRLRLERSEAYRVLRRLQALGVFGIEDDRSGQRGGRRIWRTGRALGRSGLDAARHRQAWARVAGWASARRARLAAFMRDAISGGRRVTPPVGSASPAGGHLRRDGRSSARRSFHPVAPTAPPGVLPPTPGGAVTFADLMRGAGLGKLMDSWGVTE
jgi:hypothetical protein